MAAINVHSQKSTEKGLKRKKIFLYNFAEAMMDEEALAKLSVPDLRLRLRAASLPGTGRKAELV